MILPRKICKKQIDGLVNGNDIIHVSVYTELAKSIVLKVIINKNVEDYFINATDSLEQSVFEKIKNENQFSLIAGLLKQHHSRNLLDFI